MNKTQRDQNKPIRYGNAFPWVGILAGVWRMVFYLFLVVCLLAVLGTIVLAVFALADNEPVTDRF